MRRVSLIRMSPSNRDRWHHTLGSGRQLMSEVRNLQLLNLLDDLWRVCVSVCLTVVIKSQQQVGFLPVSGTFQSLNRFVWAAGLNTTTLCTLNTWFKEQLFDAHIVGFEQFLDSCSIKSCSLQIKRYRIHVITDASRLRLKCETEIWVLTLCLLIYILNNNAVNYRIMGLKYVKWKNTCDTK